MLDSGCWLPITDHRLPFLIPEHRSLITDHRFMITALMFRCHLNAVACQGDLSRHSCCEGGSCKRSLVCLPSETRYFVCLTGAGLALNYPHLNFEILNVNISRASPISTQLNFEILNVNISRASRISLHNMTRRHIKSRQWVVNL